MRDFAALYDEIDTTTATNLKVAAMVRYFRSAAPADAAWAAYILSGRRLKRFIGHALLHRWLVEASGLPQWLVEESYSSVGDLAETIALLMDLTAGGTPAIERRPAVPAQAAAQEPADITKEPPTFPEELPLATWIESRLLSLRNADVSRQREEIVAWWRVLPYRECFLLNKLLTGELRVGVSELLVTRALAEVLEIPRPDVTRGLMGEWMPSAQFWESLRSAEHSEVDPSKPYPFYLASPLESEPAQLGEIGRWQVEWKWDGIRGQLIRRNGECFIWSRGEDLVTERFPEIVAAAAKLADGIVLDGELVAWKDGVVQPFAALQQRIGRKKLSSAILSKVPVRFLAYDLLEEGHVDIRALPMGERRVRLEALLHGGDEQAAPHHGQGQGTTATLGISPLVSAHSWEELAALRAESRSRSVEGLMLKALDSAYGTGRQRGSWWKWKIEPHTFDAVMLYAQPGHGRRSNLYTDYTFGVWQGTELVPVAKAYSGLDNTEIREIDQWIRGHTREKFGPVRSVEAVKVFELAYEGIAASSRHKSGIALRFPRILRPRPDKPASEANTLEDLKAVLTAHTAP